MNEASFLKNDFDIKERCRHLELMFMIHERMLEQLIQRFSEMDAATAGLETRYDPIVQAVSSALAQECNVMLVGLRDSMTSAPGKSQIPRGEEPIH